MKPRTLGAFTVEQAASMAAGALRGLLRRPDVVLDAHLRQQLQTVRDILHDALDMDDEGHRR